MTLLLLVGISIACQRPVRTAPLPASASAGPWPRDEYCWWTAMRTALPADSVGARFTRAYAALGLERVTAARVGDTVMVRGGPSALGGSRPEAIYASRMVAYQRGDSTRFRWYWSIAPVAGPAASSTDPTLPGRGIGYCGEIGKAVSISGWRPDQPTAEDSLPVWNRVP